VIAYRAGAGPTGQSMTPAPVDGQRFREIVGHFASGVTVVTTEVDGQPFGTTASAVTSLSLDPPMMLVCMNKESSTGQAITESGHFAINILCDGQEEVAMRFAGKSADKFRALNFVRGAWGLPLIRDALAHVVCELTEQAEAGTHRVFIAEVRGASASPVGRPMLYFRGRFGKLASAL